MGMTVTTESQAVRIATTFLNDCLPHGAPPSHIDTCHIAGDERLARQAELKEFCRQNGMADESTISQMLTKFGLTEDHWSVGFYAIDQPGTASTTPPTIVRVYDADGRVELDG